MSTTHSLDTGTPDNDTQRTLWWVAVCFIVTLTLALAMAAKAHDPRDAQSNAETAPLARSAAEIAWNANEDIKAGANVGQPGIY